MNEPEVTLKDFLDNYLSKVNIENHNPYYVDHFFYSIYFN